MKDSKSGGCAAARVLVASAFAAAMLALCPANAASASGMLLLDGFVGQSGSRTNVVPWTACRYCVSDGVGNVYLPDGIRLPVGGIHPERMAKCVKGVLMTDGRDIYSWRAEHCLLKRLAVLPDGLAETSFAFRLDSWKLKLFLAPARCSQGFAAKAKLFALDIEKREVRGWDADAKPVGRLFDFSKSLSRPELVRSVAVHQETGDLLIGVHWPECKVHRFNVDGVERIDEVWPFKAMAESFSLADGRVFATGERAYELADKFGSTSFGVFSGETYGVARVAGGWWLATSQGAQFYTDAAVRSGRAATRRIGGLSGVTALGLSGGRILVASGYAIFSAWLDDLPDEPLSSDHTWCSLGKWTGAVKAVETAADGSFLIHWSDGKTRASWQFDPRITAWKDRKKRLHPVPDAGKAPPPANEARVCGLRAVAEPREIVLYAADGQRAGSFPMAATALAAEGRWLVAYVPSLNAVARFRVESAGRK